DEAQKAALAKQIDDWNKAAARYRSEPETGEGSEQLAARAKKAEEAREAAAAAEASRRAEAERLAAEQRQREEEEATRALEA
ncbi:hypothetical protein ABTL72_19560, partial [Acinetobacter baumannii]